MHKKKGAVRKGAVRKKGAVKKKGPVRKKGAVKKKGAVSKKGAVKKKGVNMNCMSELPQSSGGELLADGEEECVQLRGATGDRVRPVLPGRLQTRVVPVVLATLHVHLQCRAQVAEQHLAREVRVLPSQCDSLQYSQICDITVQFATLV